MKISKNVWIGVFVEITDGYIKLCGLTDEVRELDKELHEGVL